MISFAAHFIQSVKKGAPPPAGRRISTNGTSDRYFSGKKIGLHSEFGTAAVNSYRIFDALFQAVGLSAGRRIP
jgi:hypothetical protein